MTDNTKSKVTDALNKGAEHASAAAKSATGWRRVALIILAACAGVAAAYLTSCTASYSQAPDGSVNAQVIIAAEGK